MMSSQEIEIEKELIEGLRIELLPVVSGWATLEVKVGRSDLASSEIIEITWVNFYAELLPRFCSRKS